MNVTYKCEIESLGDVTQNEFSAAFLNQFPEAERETVSVVFHNGKSSVLVESDEPFDDAFVADNVRIKAEAAYADCCKN